MNETKNPSATSAQDIAAFTKCSDENENTKIELTQAERDNESSPKPSVTIVDYGTGETTQASLAQLNQQMVSFHKVILLIEDTPSDSDTCARALHELGYDGVQLITSLTAAEQHLDDIVSGLTEAPAAIVLDLGLGQDSGFTIMRKCHAEPRLQEVPILVWTKHTDSLSRTFSDYLGANDYLIKSADASELRKALKRLCCQE